MLGLGRSVEYEEIARAPSSKHEIDIIVYCRHRTLTVCVNVTLIAEAGGLAIVLRAINLEQRRDEVLWIGVVHNSRAGLFLTSGWADVIPCRRDHRADDVRR
jgi:hypothetical protein